MNALTMSGILRSNIRSSFGSYTGTAVGAPLQLTITLENVSSSCGPLENYAIYIWHCNAAGKYSLYDITTVNYLRGVQVTDANGQVTFYTNFPACYSGRYPHIHIEVYKTDALATVGTNAVLTTQLPMPRDIASALYSSDSDYSGSTANLASVTTSTDSVFSSSTATQIAAQTPALTGSASAGYVGTVTLGLAA